MKLCMIGSRGHSTYVFESIARVPEVSITGISSGCADSAALLAGECADAGFSPKIYGDWREMLEKEKPFLVCVDGPFELHAEMSAEALKRGIHVFCEKPLALTLGDLERVEEARRSSGAEILAMTGMRFEPAFELVCGLARSGRLGEIRTVRIQKCYKIGKRAGHYLTRASYGGTIPWIGTHGADLLFACGCREFTRVSAWHTRAGNGGNGEMENAALVFLEGKSGFAAEMALEYLMPEGAERCSDDRIRIAGTEGIAELREGRVTWTDSSGTREVSVPERTHWIFADWVGSLAGKRSFSPTSEESISGTKLCLLARESADRGKEIPL